MIDYMKFTEIEDFFKWWNEQNPDDDMDLHEAWTIFFNQDTYIGVI